MLRTAPDVCWGTLCGDRKRPIKGCQPGKSDLRLLNKPNAVRAELLRERTVWHSTKPPQCCHRCVKHVVHGAATLPPRFATQRAH